jgi:hypothetical protein
MAHLHRLAPPGAVPASPSAGRRRRARPPPQLDEDPGVRPRPKLGLRTAPRRTGGGSADRLSAGGVRAYRATLGAWADASSEGVIQEPSPVSCNAPAPTHREVRRQTVGHPSVEG